MMMIYGGGGVDGHGDIVAMVMVITVTLDLFDVVMVMMIS